MQRCCCALLTNMLDGDDMEKSPARTEKKISARPQTCAEGCYHANETNG